MRSKKLLSLMAAATMAVSAFAGLIVTSHATSNGLELVYDKDASTATTRVIKVYINGVTDYSALQCNFTCPSYASKPTKGFSKFAISTDVYDEPTTNQANFVTTTKQVKISSTSNDYVELEGDHELLVTITLNVPEGSDDFTLKLADGSKLRDKDSNLITLDFDAEITVSDPTAAPPTEEPTDEPTDEPTEEPVVKAGDNTNGVADFAAPDDVDAGFVDEASLWQETVEANGTTYTKVKVVATNMGDEQAEGTADLGTEITGAINVFIAINTAKDNIKSLVVSFE